MATLEQRAVEQASRRSRLTAIGVLGQVLDIHAAVHSASHPECIQMMAGRMVDGRTVRIVGRMNELGAINEYLVQDAYDQIAPVAA